MAPALGLPARAGVRTDARPGLAGCGLLPCQVVSGSVLDHERDIHAGGGTGRGSEYIGAGSALFVHLVRGEAVEAGRGGLHEREQPLGVLLGHLRLEVALRAR